MPDPGRDAGKPDLVAEQQRRHLARRCEMTVSQVQDYMKRGRQAQINPIYAWQECDHMTSPDKRSTTDQRFHDDATLRYLMNTAGAHSR